MFVWRRFDFDSTHLTTYNRYKQKTKNAFLFFGFNVPLQDFTLKEKKGRLKN